MRSQVGSLRPPRAFRARRCPSTSAECRSHCCRPDTLLSGARKCGRYLEVAVDSDVALVRRVRVALPAVEQFADTRDKLDLSDVLFFGKADVAMLLAPELGEAGLAQYYTLVLEHRSMAHSSTASWLSQHVLS